MIAALAVLTLAAAPGGSRPAGYSDDQWSQLTRGEVVTRIDTGTSSRGAVVASAEAAVLIHRPEADCFGEVERYDGLSSYLPGLAESRVLDRTATGFRAHAASRVALMKVGYGLVFQLDRGTGELRWKLDPTQPADIADTDGAWQFISLDPGTTLLRYRVKVDTGFPVPLALQRYLTQRTLPETLVAFRDHLQHAQ